MEDKKFEVTSESLIIGCLMMGKDTPQIFAEMSEAEFSDPRASRIFAACKKAWVQNGKTEFGVEILSMQDEEKEYGYWSAQTWFPSVDWKEITQAVKDRNTIERAKRVAGDLLTAQTVEDVLHSQSDLIKATQQEVRETATNMEDSFTDFLTRMSNPKSHIKTGYSKLDNYTYIDKGDFVILAGEQSSGKTAFSISLAIRMARQGYKCVYFSLETSTEKIFDRLITNFCTLDFSHLKQQKMSDDELTRVAEAYTELSKLPIQIINAAGKTVEWIKAESIRLQADIIFIDYLGLIQARGRSRYEMITQTSLDLHTMAQTTGITIICLSQLKRPESGSNRPPGMHDLRESGQIEADADLIILLFNDRDAEEYWVIIAKNKEGMVGRVLYDFDGLHQSFYEVTDEYEA